MVGFVNMSVLVDKEIKKLSDEYNLIEGFDSSSLEAASYDLRLGADYMRQGVIKSMTKEEPSIAVQPGEYVVVTSHEALNFPLDLVARFGLMSPWGMKGIVSLFGPQIDPGFSGILVVPIFNAGDSPVTLPHYEKMFTVEFLKTRKKASQGWAEKYGKQERIKALHTAFQSRPNLADVKSLKDEVESLIESVEKLNLQVKSVEGHVEHLKESRNWFMTMWGLAIAITSLLLAFFSSSFFSNDKANHAETKELPVVKESKKQVTKRPPENQQSSSSRSPES